MSNRKVSPLFRRLIFLILAAAVLAAVTVYFINSHPRSTPSTIREEPTEVVAVADRKTRVKEAMRFAWQNYKQHAWGDDELKPVTGRSNGNGWGGIGMTLVDSLDTLFIMGFHEEFKEARDWVAKTDYTNRDATLNVFETIIRVLGGLLGAHSLSGDTMFLDKAVELADMLMGAYDEKLGIYYLFVNPTSGKRWMKYDETGTLAEMGTLQLEMRYLSQATGDPKYARSGDHLYHVVRNTPSYNNSGLYPLGFDTKIGGFRNDSTLLTIGARADSFYEYLLKSWVFGGKKEPWLRMLYDHSMDGLEQYLLVQSRGELFLTEIGVPELNRGNTMHHLECFVPAMLALGVVHSQDSALNKKHLYFADKLAETCYKMYSKQRTGLAPDTIFVPSFAPANPGHWLRPETVESLYYLYTITGDTKYREWGWEIFEATEKYTKTKHGYSELEDVAVIPPAWNDRMESWFLAETLKYHYLLQDIDGGRFLRDYVFTTEAHPLRLEKSHSL